MPNPKPRLSLRERAFVAAYLAGTDDTRNNAVRSYLLVYYGSASHASAPDRDYERACSAASASLRRPHIREYMREWRRRAEVEARARMRSWWELAPGAQETLERAAAGNLRFPDADPKVEAEMIRSAVRASTELLDRALGTVKQMHEHSLVGQAVVVHVAGPGSPQPQELPPGRERLLEAEIEDA